MRHDIPVIALAAAGCMGVQTIMGDPGLGPIIHEPGAPAVFGGNHRRGTEPRLALICASLRNRAKKLADPNGVQPHKDSELRQAAFGSSGGASKLVHHLPGIDGEAFEAILIGSDPIGMPLPQDFLNGRIEKGMPLVPFKSERAGAV